MADAWQILRDGGLPIATPSSGTHRSARELADAVLIAIASEPTGRDAEALAAYVLAWQQHWPTSYTRELGARSEVLAWARAHVHDDNRYLKLRRLALENLSRVL